MIEQLKRELESLGSPEKAEELQRFFRTGPGEYGEGDVFLGVSVPDQREVAGKYRDLSPQNISRLLESGVHEHRLTGLLILMDRFSKVPGQRKQIFDFYLDRIQRVNNWDLVDLSAPGIVGSYLLENPRERKVLLRLASGGLWYRRVAIVATLAFIREGRFEETLLLAELLLKDRHDLIHKAVGWMLREVGKRDQAVLESFLEKHCRGMPRTMLRYSLERLPEGKRKFYMRR